MQSKNQNDLKGAGDNYRTLRISPTRFPISGTQCKVKIRVREWVLEAGAGLTELPYWIHDLRHPVESEIMGEEWVVELGARFCEFTLPNSRSLAFSAK